MSLSAKFAVVYQISSKSDDYLVETWRFDNFQDGEYPLIDTIALNCLVFEKITFLCTHSGDRQTAERTGWTARMRKGALAVANGALITTPN